MLAWQHASRGAHREAAAEINRAAELVEQAGTTSVAAHLALAQAWRDDASRLAERFATIPTPGGRTAALIARCQGLTAEDDEVAITAFDSAIVAHTEACDEPFELARTELLLGA
jgi:hypothetical protein